MNLYNLIFRMVFVIKKLFPGGDFNFCHHLPHLLHRWPFYLYTRQESELYELYYTNSYIGAARCTLKVRAAGCTLTVGAAGNTNCTP